jgi:hypothetical protein
MNIYCLFCCRIYANYIVHKNAHLAMGKVYVRLIVERNKEVDLKA